MKTDKCDYKLPTRLQYENNNMVFTTCTEESSGIPTYRNIITEFFMQESTPLPEGLKLDNKTGEITGTPIAIMKPTAFTVHGKNPAGETFTVITISVRRGHCPLEGSASVTLELKMANAVSKNYDHIIDTIRRVVSEDLNIDTKSVVVNIKNKAAVFTPSQQFMSCAAIRKHKARNNYAVRNKDTD